MYRVNARPAEDTTDIDAWVNELRGRRTRMVACVFLLTLAVVAANVRLKREHHVRAPKRRDSTERIATTIVGHERQTMVEVVFVGLVEDGGGSYRPTCEGLESLQSWTRRQHSTRTYRVLEAIVPTRLPRRLEVTHVGEFPPDGVRVVVRARCTEDSCVASKPGIFRADAKVIAEWKRFNASSDSSASPRR